MLMERASRLSVWRTPGALALVGLAACAEAPPPSQSAATSSAEVASEVPSLLRTATAAGPVERPAPSAERTVCPSDGGPCLAYRELLTGGAKARDTLPMIVAMHGLGDRPEGFAHVFDAMTLRARVVLPRAPKGYKSGFRWFETRVDGSPEAIATELSQAAELVASALPLLAREHPTKGRPIVTGFSQGGMMSFTLAVRHGASIAAAVPIAGALPAPLVPTAGACGKDLTVAPVHALHGARDTVLPLEPTRGLVAGLAARGCTSTLDVDEAAAHTIPPAMRARLEAKLTELAGAL